MTRKELVTRAVDLFSLILILVGGSGCGSDETTAPQEVGNISGHVYLAWDTEPLDDVIMACGGIGDTTSSDGAYALIGIPAGIQTLTAQRDDYESFTKSLIVKAGTTIIYDVFLEPTDSPWNIVRNTNDSGPGSLRDVILLANENADLDSIHFCIPGPGPHVIYPDSGLPAITDVVVIDGYTQPGSATANESQPAILMIELNGIDVSGIVPGITIGQDGGGSTIRGLAIHNFLLGGIECSRSSDGNRIEGNYIGLGADGECYRVFGRGNGLADHYRETTSCTPAGHGISCYGSNNTVGGATAAARNVISNNDGSGVHIEGAEAGANVVIGSFIGTDITGCSALGNRGRGVRILNASDNTVGGDVPERRNVVSGNLGNGIGLSAEGGTCAANAIIGNYVGVSAGEAALPNGNHGMALTDALDNTIGGEGEDSGNTIAYNAGAGIYVNSRSSGNALLANAVFSNGELGIDLEPCGVTANDEQDQDTGANTLQNYPTIRSAFLDTSGMVTVSGELSSTPNTQFLIQLFWSAEVDQSGYGEGELLVGELTVTTDETGATTFSEAFLVEGISTQGVISSTATDPMNNTSEFSSVVPLDTSRNW